MRYRLIVLAAAVAAMPCLVTANQNVPGGEYAYPKRVPLQDPPPTVLWGPYQMPDLRGLQWGLYGLSYQGLNDQLHANYVWESRIRRYRSIDSTNVAMPETIVHSYVPSPVTDSFQDLAYCRYDRSVWLHSSKLKRVYKLDAVTGAVLRDFPSPATRYPVGIAFNERAKKLYLVDRMPEGTFPCSLYVTDTMGYVLQRFGLDHLGYSYSGARCLDFDYTNTNGNWPTLLMTYSYFSGSGYLDSCALFELDPDDLSIINRSVLPNLSGYVNNVRGIAWDPRQGDYWLTIMQNPDNYIYKMDGWHAPLSPDVGIMSLVAPRGVYDSATAVTPQVVVRNFGMFSVDCPVNMRIGAAYNQTRTKTLRAGCEDTIYFPVWQPQVIGTYPARCSTMLSGDLFAANDTWTEITQIVRPGLDVSCHRLMAPVGTVDSGVAVVPSCSTYNFGNRTVDYPVRMKVGGTYNRTVQVTGHKPGQFAVVQFPLWSADQRGSFAVSCSTELDADTVEANNKLTATVKVRVLDAACTRLMAPRGVVDSGFTVAPSCSVYNAGTDTATYNVRMRIGTLYDQPVLVSNQAPGEYRRVAFPNWTAQLVGTHIVRCSTELTSDFIQPNNRQLDSVIVRALDVGVEQIIAPTGTVDSGTPVLPRARVKNFRSSTVSFPVIMRIGGAYSDTQNVTNLQPNDTVTVSFDQWTALPRGLLAVRCTTRLDGDVNQPNNWLDATVKVRVLDAVCSRLLAPRGAADSGAVITPACSVYNASTDTLTYPVRMKVGTTYDDTALVANHLPGQYRYVTFADWTAGQRGTFRVRCSTELDADVIESNNFKTDSVTVSAADVGVLRITAPSGTVDSGAVIQPGAWVRNYGSRPADLPVLLRIGAAWADTQQVTGLAPGDSAPVNFRQWTAVNRGVQAVRCTTRLAGDQNEPNNWLDVLVKVRVLDAASHRLLAPRGVVDSGAVVAPACSVYNASTDTLDYRVRMKVGTTYDTTAQVSGHLPGEYRLVTFADWTANARGRFPVRCSTELDADQNNANDALSDSVMVSVADVACISITAPSGSYVEGDSVVPEAVWRNQGTGPADFVAGFFVADPSGTPRFTEQLSVTGLGPGEDSSVSATGRLVLTGLGTWSVRCSTFLAGDQCPANDTLSAEFEVVSGSHPDAGVTQILAPAGQLDTSQSVMPQSRVHNFGNVNIGFDAWFTISDTTDAEVYRQSARIDALVPGAETTLSFPDWAGTQVQGLHVARCSLAVSDEQPANDTLSQSFEVVAAHWPFGWTEMAAVPGSMTGRPVKDGAWLTVADAKVFAVRGNKTADFYRFDPFASDSGEWTGLAPVPAEPLTGRLPRKGCAAASDGERFVYMTKGNNTLGFWRYDVEQDTWVQLPDVPLGGASRRVKAGAGMAYAPGQSGTGYVYLLKGQGTEFYRWDVALAAWSVLPPAPYGLRAKYGAGSFLAFDGDRYLYCHQARYSDGRKHFMFKYDVLTGLWSQLTLAGMPLAGRHAGMLRNKRSKDGSSGAWYGGRLYALKGGNSQQFFSFEPGTAVWTELDTMPSVGSTGRAKLVRSGGSFVSLGEDAFFALKGNKTNEFWRYVQPTANSLQPRARTGVMANPSTVYGVRFSISPNPVTSSFTSIRYALPKAGPVSVTVFDVAGRSVFFTWSLGHLTIGSLPLDLRGLSAGVYLVRLDADGYSSSQKLVVQR